MRFIYDVSLLSHNFKVYICFCVCVYQGFQLFCLINCLFCNKQFGTIHLGIRYTVFSFDYKRGISLILSTLLANSCGESKFEIYKTTGWRDGFFREKGLIVTFCKIHQRNFKTNVTDEERALS